MREAAMAMSKQVANKTMIPGERPIFDQHKEKKIVKTPLKMAPYHIPEQVQEAGVCKCCFFFFFAFSDASDHETRVPPFVLFLHTTKINIMSLSVKIDDIPFPPLPLLSNSVSSPRKLYR